MTNVTAITHELICHGCATKRDWTPNQMQTVELGSCIDCKGLTVVHLTSEYDYPLSSDVLASCATL